MTFVYKKALITAFDTNFLLQYNLCEFKTQPKFSKFICSQKQVLNLSFKDFY